MTKTEKLSWEIPVRTECDVAVIGGGPAGIGAALCAARHNARTCLIERYGFLGGMGSAALVHPFMTCYSADGSVQIIKGVFEELVRRMEKTGGAIHASRIPLGGTAYSSFAFRNHDHVTPFDPEALKLTSLEMLLEAGVELHLHTRFIDARPNGGAIHSLVFADAEGLGVCRCKMAIDATGNGDVAFAAGVPCEKGRPEDGLLQPATLFVRVGHVDDRAVSSWVDEHDRGPHAADRSQDRRPKEGPFATVVEKARSEGNFPIPRAYLSMFHGIHDGEWFFNTTRIQNVDCTRADDFTRSEIEGRKQAAALMHFLRDYCPGFSNAILLETACQVGIRETRRIQGQYRLTQQDVFNGRQFDDAIARYAFPMDFHSPRDNRGDFLFLKPGVSYYEVPFRCLVPMGVENLLAAGRCISADPLAAGSVRMMPSCMATGQAAGTAAAMSLDTNRPPAELDAQRLRETLKRDGAFV